MLDGEDKSQLYARKGECITCINGHAICEFFRDVKRGDGRSAEDFTNWRQPEPDKSASVADIRCIECRGSWINGNARDGYQFHFSEGWR